MSETDAVKLQGFKTRTLQRQRELAHTVVGVSCPGCGMHIVEKGAVTDAQTEMEVASPGDTPPDKKQWKGELKRRGLGGRVKQSWPEMHKGTRYGARVPLNIELLYWILCIMHMGCRFAGMLFQTYILNMIGESPRDKKHNQQEEIFTVLKGVGIQIKETKLKKKSNKANQPLPKQINFTGEAAEGLLAIFPGLLEIVFPEKKRLQFVRVRLGYERAKDAVEKWTKCWALLNLHDTPKEEWGKLADNVQTTGTDFVNAYVLSNARTQGLYLHLLVAHTPDLIRRFGPLGYFQAQNVEHHHAARKARHLRTTNRSPTDRGRQVMSQVVTLKHLAQTLGSEGWRQRMKEKLRQSKIARMLRHTAKYLKKEKVGSDFRDTIIE